MSAQSFRISSVLAIVVTSLSVALASPAPAAHGKCWFKSARALSSNDEAVVLQSWGRVRRDGRVYGTGAVFACLRLNGRLTRLAPGGDTNDLEYSKLVGHFAAARALLDCGECGGGWDEDFGVFDLRTGRRIYRLYFPFDMQPPIYEVTDAAPAADGSFALIRMSANSSNRPLAKRLFYYPRYGKRVTLDRGLAIRGHSLGRIGSTWFWKHGSEVRSFTP